MNAQIVRRVVVVRRVLAILALTLALSSQGLAQEPSKNRFGGLINDYTPVLDAAGPWHVVGRWTAELEGQSGKGDVSLALTMVRADNVVRSFHTHHIWLTDGEVTALPNGYRITGAGVFTGNGNLAGFSGSPVTVTITGGNTVEFSNVSVTFGGAATAHFGSESFDGVVTSRQ